jgi:hypothetical protein
MKIFNKKRRSVVIALRFKGEINQIDTINFLKQLFWNKLNDSFEEITYSLLDKTKSNWRLKTKSLKFTENNFRKYQEVVNSLSEKYELSFELSKYLKDYNYKSIDLDFSVIYNSNEINSINLRLNFNNHKNIDFKELTICIVKYLMKINCQILYSFVTCIDDLKFPFCYVEGVSTTNMSQKEKKKIEIWSNSSNNCDIKIWEIFWFNIISFNHYNGKNIILEEIANVVGLNNVEMYSGDLYSFQLNENIENYDVLKCTKERNLLYKIFNKNDLLMTEIKTSYRNAYDEICKAHKL